MNNKRRKGGDDLQKELENDEEKDYDGNKSDSDGDTKEIIGQRKFLTARRRNVEVKKPITATGFEAPNSQGTSGFKFATGTGLSGGINFGSTTAPQPVKIDFKPKENSVNDKPTGLFGASSPANGLFKKDESPLFSNTKQPENKSSVF